MNQSGGHGGLSREEQIRRLQDRQSGPTDQWGRPTYSDGGAPAVHQRPGAKPIKSDDYYGAAPTGSTANYFDQRAKESSENTHAARLQKMREQRWQREHGGGGPAKSEHEVAAMRQQTVDERMRRNEENFRKFHQVVDTREEQIRKLQDNMIDPNNTSYHYQAVNQTYQGGGGNQPGAAPNQRRGHPTASNVGSPVGLGRSGAGGSGGDPPDRDAMNRQIAERDARNLAAYQARQGQKISREEKIRRLQEHTQGGGGMREREQQQQQQQQREMQQQTEMQQQMEMQQQREQQQMQREQQQQYQHPPASYQHTPTHHRSPQPVDREEAIRRLQDAQSGQTPPSAPAPTGRAKFSGHGGDAPDREEMERQIRERDARNLAAYQARQNAPEITRAERLRRLKEYGRKG
mmetsp:Transcript_8862/g.17923  ORF Transcript_8862/g.17923 Transcript_8862/m.17923 type:complete len:405 (+) Transcript_8862:170-1384(+)